MIVYTIEIILENVTFHWNSSGPQSFLKSDISSLYSLERSTLKLTRPRLF